MNMSRSRRLIVLLSHAYLEQDWCAADFRSGCGFIHSATGARRRCCSAALPLFRRGLLHLLELCPHPPIVIVLEGQSKRMRPEVRQLMAEHQHRLTVLTWRQRSVVGLPRRRRCLDTLWSVGADQE